MWPDYLLITVIEEKTFGMKFRLVLIIFITAILLLFTLIGIRAWFPKGTFTTSKINFTAHSSHKKDDGETNSGKGKSFESILRQRLTGLEIPDSSIHSRLFAEDTSLEIRAAVPKGKPMEWIILQLTSSLDKTDYRLVDCFCESEEKGCRIQYAPIKQGLPSVQLVVRRAPSYFSQTAQMAILIEDFGFQADQTTIEYLSFPEPLTVSLVASKKMATWTAQIADEYRKEILILIPMEPLGGKLFTKYKNTIIMVHYSEDKIRSILDRSIESVPNSVGFCNLSGERVLADSRVMGIICEVLKKQHGYFLSDDNSRNSVLPQLARRMEVPYGTVDFSVDSALSTATIRDTLTHFATTAQKSGKVIIRSKPTTAFITALKAQLPLFKRNGIRLVYVSDLVKNSEKE